jgi:hypothetical protein
MTFSVRKSPHTPASRLAERLAKLLTEDFSIDLEQVGMYLVQNHPAIVFNRFDVLALTAQEEYDKIMTDRFGKDYHDRFRK